MPSRKKTTKSAGNANRRGKRRAPISFSNVKPVAIASADSSEAVIPVAIKTAGDSPDAEAVIPVEVQTSRGKTRKRAAVVPVTVKRRRARTARESAEKVVAIRQTELREERAPKQRDIVTRSVVALTDAEETAVNLAGHFGITVMHVVPRLMRSALGTVARQVDESAEAISSEIEAAEETLAA